MKGIRPDGTPVTHHRRGRDAGRDLDAGPPTGPLDRHVVDAVRGIHAGALRSQDYTAAQIGQVLGCSARTVRRLLAAARDRHRLEDDSPVPGALAWHPGGLPPLS